MYISNGVFLFMLQYLFQIRKSYGIISEYQKG